MVWIVLRDRASVALEWPTGERVSGLVGAWIPGTDDESAKKWLEGVRRVGQWHFDEYNLDPTAAWLGVMLAVGEDHTNYGPGGWATLHWPAGPACVRVLRTSAIAGDFGRLTELDTATELVFAGDAPPPDLNA